ncbi:hypothetical protein chiPu_0025611, partial [Chiloscyllium punctatum]|nr:hypothetical protein [Chiloscyllium punctatum]
DATPALGAGGRAPWAPPSPSPPPWWPYRGEDFCGLLNGGDLRPAPPLEELDPGGVVEGGGRVGPEEGGEALAVGESRRAGTVRELQGEGERERSRADGHRRTR